MSQVSTYLEIAAFELESRSQRQQHPVRIRTARPEDGQEIWELVRSTNVLDVNSSYMYLLLCDRFGETCLVAESNNEIIGFVAAFIPPKQADVIFVWQIGVSDKARGRGVAGSLLDALLHTDACHDTHYLETTITPSNKASQALFKSFARRQGATVRICQGYAEHLFPGGHEPEQLYRIGAFSQTN